MKTLAQIAEFFALQTDAPGLVVQGLTPHAQLVEPGWGFVALPGAQRHGHEFWQQAKARGAVVVLSNQPIADCDLPVLVVDELPARLAELANWFYDYPSHRIEVIGVTGTNGKTSTTHYLAQLLHLQGQRVGVIGTLGNGEYGYLEPSANTTPDVLVVQAWLARFVQQGLRWAVMEVSSHGLALGRIHGVRFACVALTQVTRDHLDFHKDVADYQATKMRLFQEYETRYRVVNLDDAIGRKIADHQACFGYSMHNRLADLFCGKLVLNSQGLSGEVTLGSNHQAWSCGLLGKFNAENILCVLSCLAALGFEFNSLVASLAKLQPVAGRMQQVEVSGRAIKALVDYAHTPDALEQVLLAIRAHVGAGHLWVVFGCGGDRDKGKRPLMGEVAQGCADHVVVTSDNPRSEQAQQIIDDILVGMSQPVKVVNDRRAAIEWALAHAKEGDMVLVAGKGHEDYQEIQGVRYPFSDQKVIEQWRK